MSSTAACFAPLLLSAFALTAVDAHAQQRERDDEGERRRETRDLSDTVRRVERETQGEVLSAERVPFDGRNVHRIKVLDDSGRVRVYMDDPRPKRPPSEPPRTRDNDD